MQGTDLHSRQIRARRDDGRNVYFLDVKLAS